MADNITILNASVQSRTMRTTDDAGVHTPHHHVDSMPAAYERDSDGELDDAIVLIGGRQFSIPNASALDDGARVEALFDNKHRLWVRLATDENVPVALASGSVLTADLRTDRLMNGAVALTPKFKVISVAGDSTNAEVVAAVTSKKIRVINYTLTVGDVVTTVVWGSASTSVEPLTGVMRYGANGGAAVAEAKFGHFETSAGEALVMTTTGTGSATTGSLVYVEV